MITPDDIAMAILFCIAAGVIALIALVALAGPVYRAICAVARENGELRALLAAQVEATVKAEEYGVLRGELNERRRMDEANVRARERAGAILRETVRGGDFHEEELDV